MESKQRVAIVGAGPAGCTCAYFLQKDFNVTLFDPKSPLYTILYTGGGRCNLAYAEYDFKELAKFFPRGEKFLYSVFSQFSTTDTINFFNEIGVSTYIQDDLRVFPQSNSAKDLREKFLNKLKKCSFKKEKVINIDKINSGFSLKTPEGTYFFDKVIVAVGGHAGFDLAKSLGHKIVEPKPSLTGLISKEMLKPLQGLSMKNISAGVYFQQKKITELNGDLLFTHDGISGPISYMISSVCARIDYSKNNPLMLKFNFLSEDIDFQQMLNQNSKKDIKNLVSELVPKSLAEYILGVNDIKPDLKCFDINGKTRDLILKSLNEFEINVVSPAKEGEIVTSGGVCLDEINPKTIESKLVNGLYFCGEVIDVDGFCGGFNLQNCWSTGFVVAKDLLKS